MIPDFEGRLLPIGIHSAKWPDITSRLAWTVKRVHLVGGLRLALKDLAHAGCARAYLNGSFVTTADFPGDYDLCWDTAGVQHARLHPILLAIDAPRIQQKVRYRGDILPNVIELSCGQPFVDFFQVDKITGSPKGIVVLNPLELDHD